jgi:acyl-CoA dehydrogenase
MDFRPDPELEEFRATVRDFLRQSLPEDLAHKVRGMSSERPEMIRWQRILTAHGWGAPRAGRAVT